MLASYSVTPLPSVCDSPPDPASLTHHVAPAQGRIAAYGNEKAARSLANFVRHGRHTGNVECQQDLADLVGAIRNETRASSAAADDIRAAWFGPT